jgi:hypothetical protein
VSLNNGVGPGSPFATEMDVSMSVFDEDGTRIGTVPEVGTLQPGEARKVDIEELLGRLGSVPEGDLFCTLHLVPAAMAGKESVTVSTAEMMAHMSASDDFIEYRQREGDIVTGVAYQTGPMNDPRMSSTRTAVVQAPKVIVSEPVDTLFALLNISTRFDYDNAVKLDFWILGPRGNRVALSSVEVPAFSFRLVSVTETLEEAGRLEEFRAEGGVGMFLGYAKNGSVVPLSLTRNKRTGAIACDHTLPPVYYVSTWGGEARLRGNERLEAELFSAPRPEAAEAAKTRG